MEKLLVKAKQYTTSKEEKCYPGQLYEKFLSLSPSGCQSKFLRVRSKRTPKCLRTVKPLSSNPPENGYKIY